MSTGLKYGRAADTEELPPDADLARVGRKADWHVRGELWARLTRSLAIELVDLATSEPDADGETVLGVRSGGAFFAIGPADPA